MKQCKSCKINKQISEFGKNNRTKDSLANLCKKCDSKRVNEYQKRTGSEHKRSITRHNITIEEYNALLEKQKGVCAICSSSPKNVRLVIDHNHKCCDSMYSCGKCIRGLLCRRCNLTLGVLEANFEKFKIYAAFV